MYYNRDLSWLGFNKRVLMEAADESVPLFERFRFLSIFSSNLDEFFRVRYPAIAALSTLKPKMRHKILEDNTQDLATTAQEEVQHQLAMYGNILTQALLPALDNNGIHIYYDEAIHPDHKNEVSEIFLSRALAFVQPQFLKQNATSSFTPENNKLYFLITLKRHDADELLNAVVEIPSEHLPRFYALSAIDGKEYIIFLDDVVRSSVHCIFPGFEISGVYSFKFNRDAELHLEESYADGILHRIERQLKKREYGPPSRFLFEPSMPQNLRLFLASSFGADHDEMFEGGRYHNLKDFVSLPLSGKGLEYPSRKPLAAPGVQHCSDIFGIIESRDVLLHFPYDSYNPILAFFNQAAIDPAVTRIYITLYRVASDSLIVNALISAARNGKLVTVFVELKARFDESNNIHWSRRMVEAGINIVYSIPDIKVHAKTALVIRKMADGEMTSFGLISTGNFNESTARFYTDHTILTVAPQITLEMLELFRFLRRKSRTEEAVMPQFNTLLVAGANMIEGFQKLVYEEMDKVRQGGKGYIAIKLNNLEEPGMIALLQKAAEEGVQIRLLIRGICCLVPNSPHIEVRRIVDRYLEHARIFMSGEGEDVQVFMGSADWMTRNLHHRVEVVTPILDTHCRQQLTDYFNIQWANTKKAVRLLAGGDQEFISLPSDEAVSAQDAIYDYLKTRA